MLYFRFRDLKTLEFYLSKLYHQRRIRTHDTKIKSRVLHWRSQLGAQVSFFFFLILAFLVGLICFI